MIRIFENLEALSQAAAEIFADLADNAIATNKRFSVALSGGSTPRRLYEILAADPYRRRIAWDACQVFFGDERCVPANDDRSNLWMARQALLDHVPLPANHIHPIQVDLPPAQAAMQYEADLHQFFANRVPQLDLILLGLGDNGHTASLFPHTAVLNEHKRWVAEVYVAELSMHRITFTAPLINLAARVIFLVSGADKASALQNVLEGAYQPQEYPAQLIRPTGEQLLWLVDRAASRKLAMEIEESA
jgi:6-phosphogluconolactonase